MFSATHLAIEEKKKKLYFSNDVITNLMSTYTAMKKEEKNQTLNRFYCSMKIHLTF